MDERRASRGHAARGVRDGAAGEPELERRRSALGRPRRARGRFAGIARRPRSSRPAPATRCSGSLRASPPRSRRVRRTGWQARGLLAIVLLAFVLGVAGAMPVGGGRRINLLAPPLWGVLAGTSSSTSLIGRAGRLTRLRAASLARDPSSASPKGCCACASDCRARRAAAAPVRCARFAALWARARARLALLRAREPRCTSAPPRSARPSIGRPLSRAASCSITASAGRARS
jgi:hypothetical protein